MSGRHITISVSMSAEQVEDLDDYVADSTEHRNRSEAVQQAIRRLTDKEED